MFSCIARSSVLVLLLAAPVAGQAREGSFELAAPSPLIRSERSENGILNRAASSSGSNRVFREPPSLSTRYTLNGHTVLPYVGIGYGAGEPIDANRMMMRDNAGQSSMQEDRILRDVLGKNVMPNEFQLGVRIPF
jgi:hypothetical protein